MSNFPSKNNEDNIMPLSDCAEWLEGVNVRQLQRWAESRRNNGFPEPVEILGKYKLYDVYAVRRWVRLWQKVAKNMGRGDELNA